MRHLLVLFFLCTAVPQVLAQPANARKETIDGKVYYLHTVEKGETVYGIARKYNLKQDEVLKANPAAEKGISPGMELKIPTGLTVTEKEAEKTPVNTVKADTIRHTVKKGETVYGIAKTYDTTPEAIYQHNEEARNGISPGQVLKIEVKPLVEEGPVPEKVLDAPAVAGGHVLIEHKVQKGETIFSLSKQYGVSQDSLKLFNDALTDGLKLGQTLVIPVKKSLAQAQGLTWYPDLRAMEQPVQEVQPVGPLIKEVYEVGVFMPFYLDRNQSILDSRNPLAPVELYEPTRQSLDFYHGVLLAADSLSKAGLSVNLRIYDTYRDSARLAKLIREPEFAKLDLIIGPTDQVEIVARAAAEHQIPLVCPFGYTNRILLNNPYVAKAITSSSLMIEEVSRFVASRYAGQNIILVDGKGKKEEGVVNLYRKQLTEKLARNASRDSLHYVKTESYSGNAYIQKLQKDKINVFIVPSNDFSFVSSFFSNLNNLSIKAQYKDYRIVIFGTDEWLKYDDIEASYKNKFSLHVPSPVYVNYSDTATIPFIRAFRSKFQTDPDRYAMMGFDLAYFFLSGYIREGKGFIQKLESYQSDDMVNTRFRFRKVNENGGYLNTNVYILKYENFRLIKQN